MSITTRMRPSPSMVVAVVALSFALAGSAIAGTEALKQAVTKSTVKKIAKKQANKVLNSREASLSVAKAKDADTVGGVPASQLTIGRSAFDADCDDPAAGSPVACVSLTMTLPRAGRVLLNSSNDFLAFAGPADGICNLTAIAGGTASTAPANVIPGTVMDGGEQTDTTTDGTTNGQATSVVTGNLAAGTYTFAQVCEVQTGNLDYENEVISAVLLGSA